MTIINRTQEIVRKLASWEVLCPDRDKFGASSCPTCKGTGKVARLPILREPCPCLTTYAGNYFPAICGSCLRNIPPGELESDQWTDEKNHSPSCKVCRGAGWVPAEPSLELAHEILWDLETESIRVFKLWEPIIKQLPATFFRVYGGDQDAEGIDELEATWAMVEKVAEKETKRGNR